MDNDFVTISVEEHIRLIERDKFLEALEYAGVDNWEGYSEAKREYNKEEEN